MSACPHSGSVPVPDPARSQRKAVRPEEAALPEIEERHGTWHIRSLALVREVLRAGAQTKQAGFASEVANQAMPLNHRPVLYADGPEHRRQRTKIARFFAPAVVNREYRELVSERADAFLAHFDDGAGHDLSDITLQYSTQVAARVIGLTASRPEKMARRLTSFFDQPATMLGEPLTGWARVKAAPDSAIALGKLGWFFLKDVRPAIKEHRTALEAAEHDDAVQAPDDVISHLIGEGYLEVEILMECLTYGAAGMVTTREFLQMAAWHLLDNDALRLRFLDGDSAQRWEILHEILRLEPVVGYIYRRTNDELRLVDEGGAEHVIPAGSRLQLHVRQADADPRQVGEDAHRVCPGRDLPRGVRAEVMAFGDGAHRCPGNSIAMLESEIFLDRLLRRDVSMVGQPRIEWEDVVAGYAVRGLVLRAPLRAVENADDATGHGHAQAHAGDHHHPHGDQERFNANAAEWDADSAHVTQSSEVAEAIAAAVPLRAGMRVLDYGAGTGLVAQALLKRVPGLHVVVADPSSGMREQLEAKVADGRLPEGTRVWDLNLDTTALIDGDWSDERFDLVFSSNVLHHVEHLDRVLADFAMLTVDGGCVAVAEIERPADADLSQPGSFGGHHGFPRAEIAERVRAAGLAGVVITEAGTLTKEGETFPVFLTVGRK